MPMVGGGVCAFVARLDSVPAVEPGSVLGPVEQLAQSELETLLGVYPSDKRRGKS